jgi:uroporphyrinogen III methyltransferase/synthase
VVSSNAVAEGLLGELERMGPWNQKRIMLPRAEDARDILPETLKAWGALVDIVTAYRTVAPDHADKGIINEIIENRYDLITFTSSSTFLNFVKLTGLSAFDTVKTSLKAASIGPVTTSTLLGHGVKPKVNAVEHTINGLITAIKEYFAQ